MCDIRDTEVVDGGRSKCVFSEGVDGGRVAAASKLRSRQDRFNFLKEWRRGLRQSLSKVDKVLLAAGSG